MGREENWKIPTDAEDYFGQQGRKLQIADRRPVIKRASDLVGPGIGAAAVPITDYNDILATYNGYYSSVPGVSDAPNGTDSFVGTVVMDSELGGVQEFISLTTGYTYRRLFIRSPADPDSISFQPWTSDVPAPVVASYWIGGAGAEAAKTNNGWNSHDVVPTASVTDAVDTSVFEPVAGGLQFNTPGLYLVDATASFSVGLDGIRMGFGFFTSGAPIPSVAAAGTALGGILLPMGGATLPYFSAHSPVRITAPGQQVRMQNFYQSTGSRTVTVLRLTAFRLGD